MHEFWLIRESRQANITSPTSLLKLTCHFLRAFFGLCEHKASNVDSFSYFSNIAPLAVQQYLATSSISLLHSVSDLFYSMFTDVHFLSSGSLRVWLSMISSTSLFLGAFVNFCLFELFGSRSETAKLLGNRAWFLLSDGIDSSQPSSPLLALVET